MYKRQSQISYMGFSALLSYVAQIIQFASRFGVVWLMMLSFTNLAGFGLWEVLVIFALELFSYALANAFLQPFWKMRDLVFGGEMDFYLVRPVNTLYYIMTKGFAPGYTAHIVLSTIVLVTASVQLGRFASPGFWLLVILTILVGTGIQFGLRCIPAFLTFWFGNIDNLHWLVGQFRSVVRYPLSIYPVSYTHLIMEVSRLKLTLNGTASEYDITRTKNEEKSTESNITYDLTIQSGAGKEISYDDTYQPFYKQLIAIAVLNTEEVEYSGEPVFKVEYSYFNGNADSVVEFYAVEGQDRYVAMRCV